MRMKKEVILSPRKVLASRGIINSKNENNCFLAVIIQAFWHLNSFREGIKAMRFLDQKYPNVRNHKSFLLRTLQTIFSLYENGPQRLISVSELRKFLSTVSPEFQLGYYGDTAEVLLSILELLHMEKNPYCCVESKCLSHLVFGTLTVEQLYCSSCEGPVDTVYQNRYLWHFSGNEIFANDSGNSFITDLFSCACVQGDDIQQQKSLEPLLHGLLQENSDSRPHYCTRKGILSKAQTLCDRPLAIVLSVGWQADTSNQHHRIFMNMIDMKMSIASVLPIVQGDNDDGPHYLFRGLIVYYSFHYVAIFDVEPRGFYLYDDDKVVQVGTWTNVLAYCTKTKAIPVLLFYELILEI